MIRERLKSILPQIMFDIFFQLCWRSSRARVREAIVQIYFISLNLFDCQ